MQQIVIIGGGVVGLSTGLMLARAGHRVTVLDSDQERAAASWGNAGHIAVEQVAPFASPAALRSAWGRRFAAGGALDLPIRAAGSWLPFFPSFLAASRPARFRAGSVALRTLLVEAMPAWRRLATAAGRPDLVREDGHLVAWESSATAERGATAWRAADTASATVRAAGADDRKRIATVTTAPIAGAIRFAGSGQIADLGALATALETALLTAGGRMVQEHAAPHLDGSRVLVPGHAADLVIVAAGVRSRPAMEALGHRAPLIAERGYHIRAAADRWPVDLPPLVFEDRSMIVTRFANTVQAASFVEFGTPNAPPDLRKWERLEQHVRALGLPIEPPFSRWMGSRPTLPDYLPAIGRSRRADNLVYAFGHQHLGLTLAAVTAEQVAALLAGDRPSIDLSPFDLERFGGRR